MIACGKNKEEKKKLSVAGISKVVIVVFVPEQVSNR